VRRVIRRTLAIALPLAAVLLTGCSTFSDSANVARVGDATLSADDFQATLSSAGAPDDQPLPGDAVRAQITTWIQEQLANDDTPGVSPEEAAEIYDAGIESSGTACINGIVVADEDTASSVLDDLAGGADFADVLAAENLDPSLGDAGGDVGCITAEQAEQAGDIPFVQTALSLNADDPIATAPLLNTEGTEFGWVVLQFRTFSELSEADAETVTAAIDTRNRAATTDVYVDPRYGTWDPSAGQVVALG
jgi:hypothetical protein